MSDFMDKLIKITNDAERLNGRGITVLPMIPAMPAFEGARPSQYGQGQADQIMRRIVAAKQIEALKTFRG